MDINTGGMYPMASPGTMAGFGPPDPNDPNDPRNKGKVPSQAQPGPMMRRPTGDLSPAPVSSAPVKVEGQQPEKGPDNSDQSGQLPGTNTNIAQDVSGNLKSAEQSSSKLQSFGPEPTWNTLPDQQKHHGFRKALDYIAGIGLGVGSLNPMAGVGMYNYLSRTPLREAQETYQAETAPVSGEYERSLALAKQGTSEEQAAARETSYQSQLALRQKQVDDAQRKTLEYGQKIVRYFQQDDGQGNKVWKGEQANGNVVDAEPPADQKELATQEEWKAREREADHLGLTGEDRTLYIADPHAWTTKKSAAQYPVPPRQPNEAEEQYQDWRKAYKAQNGRDPNADEINNYRRNPGGRPPHAKDRQTFEEHWQKQFTGGEATKEKKRQAILKQYGADRDPKGLDEEDRRAMQAQLDQVESDWNERKQALQDEKDTEADQYGIYGQQQPQQPQAAPAQQQQKPAPRQAAGQGNQGAKPKTVTQAQVKAYADRYFNGDINKATAYMQSKEAVQVQ